jgi:GNAT superfamily N-acetyltransferase
MAVELRVERADSTASLALQRAFFADIAMRYPGWTPGSSQPVEPSELAPPTGVWLVAYLNETPVGCGGLQALDHETAEVRRIYLADEARGRGIGRQLLSELERYASGLGCRRVLLTTGDGQPEAVGLFRSAGYAEIAPFTDGAFTTHWMEKLLTPTG